MLDCSTLSRTPGIINGCLNTLSLNLSDVWNWELSSIQMGCTDISWPLRFWCQNCGTLVDTGAEQRHSDANFPPARNPRITAPDWEINTILWKCAGEHTFIPQYLDCTYPLHLHHGPCLHEMVKVMQTLTFSHLRRSSFCWKMYAQSYISDQWLQCAWTWK